MFKERLKHKKLNTLRTGLSKIRRGERLIAKKTPIVNNKNTNLTTDIHLLYYYKHRQNANVSDT